MATLIRATGGVDEITPAAGAGGTFTLQELQAIVGGYIEVFPVPDGRFMYLNEDGKRLQLPLNREATARVRHWLYPGDVIVGDVVICSRAETDGEEEEPDES